ncbi:hypothetical protein GTW25_10140 [Aliihoeflea aestuarii]|jgi:hypothetical protein|uniref:COG3904 family protein n=1 Tax=Aliihoeflea aestuarii TaxID=453840 RepID=UPI0020932271|nr:hypothetical protein [Aliihoeflea aestuarii]MCO6391388.1 hypothetical protein [Aliihoeflea aestuarii]
MTTNASIPEKKSGFAAFVDRVDDGNIMRFAFGAMLAGTVCVLALDLNNLRNETGGLWPSSDPAVQISQPILPPAVETDGSASGSQDPRENVETNEAALKDAIRFELRPGGVLAATGSIDVGSSTRLAAELDARGEYVRTVALDSPGGSLEDAMAMARMIRERDLGTLVPDGALCASSCPLVLAGGTTRTVGEKAAVGLHQFYSGTANLPAPEQAMSDAQVTAARISRYLAEMGVEPAMWLHALDTPPRALYYLSPQEMAEYKLVTTTGPLAMR